MSTTIIKRKEIAVPAKLIVEVAGILDEHDLNTTLVGSDEDDDTVTLKIEYSKEERDAIHEIEDLITDYEEDGEDDDDGDD